MPTFQDTAPGSKSSKFTALDPFTPFLAQPGDDLSKPHDEGIMSEDLDRRLQQSCRVGNTSNMAIPMPSMPSTMMQPSQNFPNASNIMPTNENKNFTNTAATNNLSTQSNLNSKTNKDDDDDDDDDDEWDSDNDDQDPTLEAFRQRRLAELKARHMQQTEHLSKGHGQVRTITQDEFLPECTGSSEYVVVHWFHNDFERCKIMDAHLSKIAPAYLTCKFLRINVEKAPFFVTKLKIQTLPTVIVFQNGKAINRLIGFDGLVTDIVKNSKKSLDEWPTKRLVQWLSTTGAIVYKPGGPLDESDDEDSDYEDRNRYSVHSRFHRYDEDS